LESNQTAPVAVDAHRIGPATRQFVIAAPASGAIAYQVDNRRPRRICLSPILGRRRLGVLAIRDGAAFLDPANNQLLAVGYYHREGAIAYLMGERFGLRVNIRDVVARIPDPLDELIRLQAPVIVDRDPPRIRLRFVLNTYNRDRFTTECLNAVDSDEDFNALEMAYDPATGLMAGAQVMRIEKETGKRLKWRAVRAFPLVWPVAPGEAAPKTAPIEATVTLSGAPVFDLGGDQIAPPWLRGAKQGEPAPVTGLPVKEMLRAIDAESAPDVRWEMIRANLELKKPDRTYQLLTHYGDLIGEKTTEWTAEHLRECFKGQSGAALIAVAAHFPVDKALATAEDSPGEKSVVEWVGVREVERLLALDVDQALGAAAAARRVLNVSPEADAKALRRVWRRQMGWLRADFGRQEERAIHRKKDAIAKLLNQARDILSGRE